MSFRTHIAYLQQSMGGKMPLNVEVEILHIRSLNVPVEREHVALEVAGGFVTKNRLSGDDRTTTRETGIQTCRKDGLCPAGVITGPGEKKVLKGKGPQSS